MKLLTKSTLSSLYIKESLTRQYRSICQVPPNKQNNVLKPQIEYEQKYRNPEHGPNRTTLLSIAAASILGYHFLVNEKEKRHALSWVAPKGPCEEKPKVNKGRCHLPTYTFAEVQRHNCKETGIWVAYGDGVYDMTDYVKEHPGGVQILAAAGDHMEHWWRLYPYHEDMPAVMKRLEELRIGNLAKEDRVEMEDFGDPYSDDPERHEKIEPIIKKPFCGGVRFELLADNFITPNEYFFVRNHLPVPHIDPNNYEVTIEVEGTQKCFKLTLDDIKKMPKTTIVATLMCAGNRRDEMMKATDNTMAVQWNINGMSNARWTGVKLRDLLKQVCINEDNYKKTPYKHIQFYGADIEANGSTYGASIPIFKALDKYGDVLLAYEMNGQPLPLDHGYPLRVIVPGHTSARSVKWLTRIIVSANESLGHYQQIDYKSFGPSVRWDTADYKSAPAIQEIPVTSAICRPNDGGSVCVIDGCINMKGYAHSGGGRKIIRVDVTIDQGKTWHTAHLDRQGDQEPPHNWAWTIWSANIPVPTGATEVEIWCKAVDSQMNTQPESFENIFHFKGCLCNAYHRIKVKLK